MDNPEASMTEYHLEKSVDARLEVRDLMQDMDPYLKKAISEKIGSLPAIEIRKDELGKRNGQYDLNSQETIKIKPIVGSDENSTPELSWIVSKANTTERKLPVITAEPITAEEIEKYRNDLPRTYRGIGEDDKAWLFKDDSGKPTGWVVVSEQGKDAHIGFIGVSVNSEQLGFGSSIMCFLQEKYEELSLSMVPYDTAGRGHEEARKRLARFYMRNGFYNTNGGFLSWSKNDANIETTSGDIVVDNALIAQGTRYECNNLLEAYLSKVSSNPETVGLFSNKEISLLKSWIELRKESRTLESESDKYYRLLEEHKWQQKMAKYSVTETVGLV